MKIDSKNNNTKSSTILKVVSISSLSLSVFLAAGNVSAGAWVAEEGSGYIKLGYADFESDSYRGDNSSFESFRGRNNSLYAEYGLGNKIAIYGSLLHQSYDQLDAVAGKSSAIGFGDLELGVRYQWKSEGYILSSSFLVKTPFLYEVEDGLGNGQEDYETKILFGKGLNQYGYVGAEIGYRLRTGDPSDEYRYLLEYGFNVNKNLYFRTKLDGILSAENAEVNASLILDNLSNPLEFDSGKIELTAGWNFKRSAALKGYGLELTYTREIYGENILEGNSLQLGMTKVF